MSKRRREAAPSRSAWASERLHQARWPEEKAAKMTNINSGGFIAFIPWAHLKRAVSGSTQKCLAIAIMVATLPAPGSVALAQDLDSSTIQKEAAQDRTAQPPAPQNQTLPNQAAASQNQRQLYQLQVNQPANSAFTLPAGTKLPMGLLRPLSVNSARQGTDVYLQITFPVAVGNQVLVPPGTYVQGAITRVIHRDRANAVLEFEMGSASMIFGNGYTVPISGTVRVSPTIVELIPARLPNGKSVPAMAAVGSLTPPTLPTPSLGNLPRNAMIGMGVAAAVSTTVLILLARNGRGDVEMEPGTALQIVLSEPVTLDSARVMRAIEQYSQQTGNAPTQVVPPLQTTVICYEPGTPGTPDIVIPGSPGTPGTPDTPATESSPVIPGTPATPATPDRVIPGTPVTPGREYPCPR
jgi:hypothetical protein